MPVVIRICNRLVRVLPDSHRIEPANSESDGTPPGISNLIFEEFEVPRGAIPGRDGLFYIGHGDNLIYLVLQDSPFRGTKTTLALGNGEIVTPKVTPCTGTTAKAVLGSFLPEGRDLEVFDWSWQDGGTQPLSRGFVLDRDALREAVAENEGQPTI